MLVRSKSEFQWNPPVNNPIKENTISEFKKKKEHNQKLENCIEMKRDKQGKRKNYSWVNRGWEQR